VGLGGDVNAAHREVAHLILRRLIAYLEGDIEALDDLIEGLQSEGIAADTIREALELLLEQTEERTEELVPAQSVGDPRRRVLSAEERESLTAEAYGYLVGLSADGRLRGDQLEQILAQLGENDLPVDLERIQELAWQVTIDAVEGEHDHVPIRFIH
jgi:uncharacterized protein Smg (DUF494 family)